MAEPDHLLGMLRRHAPSFVSGEDVRRELDVSRQAVWKQVQHLRRLGYGVEGRPHQGYRLLSVPDRLLPAEIHYGLGTVTFGQRIVYLERTPSTSDTARDLARQGAPEGTLVVAEEQTAGRGRRGRSWHCPFGRGLLFSLILRPAVRPSRAPQVTMVAAVALALAIEKVTGLAPGIKWPNDLLLEGKKVCGILTELDAEPESVSQVVIGVGVNVNIAAEDLDPHRATSLQVQAGQAMGRLRLLQEALRQMEEWYGVWQTGGFSVIRTEWQRRALIVDRLVRVRLGDTVLAGRAAGVDEEGALLLDLPDGTRRRLLAGEVTFEESYGRAGHQPGGWAEEEWECRQG
ncbi:MAG: biotin--[acetyl-CoA-carboxylase] ligase [Peptococcaceae bacterium]|nr:biotin--[acetyl-CoA-carboxylase] ligase [Peptococcaceae bacterium]